METLLDCKSNNFKFLTSFPLDIREWSTEAQILLCFYTVVCEPILRHWSLCAPTENILSSHFLMFSGGYRKRHVTWKGFKVFKSSCLQMFFRIGALKNLAIFKEKQLSWSLFLTKLRASSPAALFKRDSNSAIFLWILRNF